MHKFIAHTILFALAFGLFGLAWIAYAILDKVWTPPSDWLARAALSTCNSTNEQPNAITPIALAFVSGFSCAGFGK